MTETVFYKLTHHDTIDDQYGKADLLDPPIVKGSRVRHDVLGVTGVVRAVDSGRAWFTTTDGGEFVRSIEQLENIS